MAPIKVFTDSSSDLSLAYYEENGVSFVPFYATFDKQLYRKEHVELPVPEFYRILRETKAFPSTSLPTVTDYEEAFTPYLDQGFDVICLCLTSLFSGSYQCAATAVEELRDKYPERRIAAIDSIQASSGQGLLLAEIVRMRDAGLPFDEILARIDALKSNARVFFTIDSLEYLQKGGRIGKVSALAGTLFNIKPIIVMRDGELHPDAKVRGRSKAIERVLEMAKSYAGADIGKYLCAVIHSDCYDEAVNFQRLAEQAGFIVTHGIQTLGVTIGAHTGPSVLGLALVKRYDA